MMEFAYVTALHASSNSLNVTLYVVGLLLAGSAIVIVFLSRSNATGNT